MTIQIRSIPHASHRYPTVGDYWEGDYGSLEIRVSKELPPKYQFLVALHEWVEATLCDHRHISFDDIDAFDVVWESTRDPNDMSEPGDQLDAPYREEHRFATIIEQLVARELNVDWDDYNKTCEELFK